MVKTKFYLDARRASDAEKACTLRINISFKRQTASFPLGVQLTPQQWNATTQRVILHPRAMFYNNYLAKRKVEVDTLILKLQDDGVIDKMTAVDIRDFISQSLAPAGKEPKRKVVEPETFVKWFDKFTARKSGRTAGLYVATRKHLQKWLGVRKLQRLMFDDIKVSWLEDLEDFLAQTNCANSIAIHLRNIRAVVNYAIDNEITTTYAFRRFKIKSEPTRKRNFDVATLRRIIMCEGLEDWEIRYRDYFTLTFMLIGINVKDMCLMTDYRDGRISYNRAKTHRPYSIKVEPEAAALIAKYAGTKHVLNYLDNCHDYRLFYNNLMKGLNSIKKKLGLKELTSYWARHSWATIAASLDIPKDTIAAALGHGGHTVTDIYIEFDMRKVDEANRKVLDWVLYGKRPDAPVKRGRPSKANINSFIQLITR